MPASLDIGLIPPARLGPFVEAVRHQLGLSLQQLADKSDGLLSVSDIKLIETGRLACSESQLQIIRSQLGIPLTSLIPGRLRLQIDYSQGRLVVGGTVAQVMPDCSHETLIIRYLSLVYLCRGVRPGAFMVPRADDVDVLAGSLGLTAPEIRQLLARVTREHRDELRVETRTNGSKLVIPGLGLFVGKLAEGGLLLIDHESSIARPYAGGGLNSARPSKNAAGHDSATMGVVIPLERKHADKHSRKSQTSPLVPAR